MPARTLPAATPLLLSALLLSWVCPAQTRPDPLVGTWSGALSVGTAVLEVQLHVTAADGGGYAATFDSVTQGALGIPVASLARDGDRVTAKLPRIGATYEATLRGSADDRVLDGTWSQGGQTLELDLRPGAVAPPARPQHPKPPFPYDVVDVRFGHDPDKELDASFRVGEVADGVTLAGTLTLPRGDGPHPAAVLITGSGPQDRDETVFGHKPFWVLADHLARRGIAVLRYDDRGAGASTGDFANATSADFATDARAALRYLATRDDIDPARLGVIGHSEGGLIAPMVASGPDRDVLAFAVLLAPPAVNIREVIVHQSRLILAAEGEVGAEAELDLELTDRAFDAVAAHDDDAARRRALAELAAEYWPKLSDAARAQVGDGPDALAAKLAELDRPWMRWLSAYDPLPALRGMRCDVLALFGGVDLQVDPAQNRPPLERALEGRRKPAKVVTLPGHNHLFQRSETGRPSEYAKLEETFSEQALAAVGDWLVALLLERREGR